MPWINLVSVYTNEGRYDQAMQQGQAAVRLSPDDAVVVGNLAGIYLALGRFAEAKALATRALTKAPDATVLHRLLWLIGSLQGDQTLVRQQSGTAYQDFLAAMKSADADLPVLTQARAEYAALK